MRVLFITATRIGDAVLSTGLLRHLLAAHPGARVTVAAGRPAAPLFGAVPGLERVLIIDKKPWGRHWFLLWRQVCARRWDLVVDLRSSAIAYTLLARRRLVSGRADSSRHRVEELGALLGLDPPPAPTAWTLEPHRRVAADLVPDGPPVLALGPAANWPGKQWPPERFAELAERLTAPDGILPDARIAVFAAKQERRSVMAGVRNLPQERTLDLIGRVELPVAAACLARCAFYVGNDSGLMHLAAAAGVPTLGLFGPSRESRYRPWGAHSAYVRTPESFEELTGGPDYDHRTTGTLMGGLSVDHVEAAARRLWARARSTRQGS